MVVIRLSLSWLSVSKHNAWSYRYYGWVCRSCCLSVNTICSGIMVGLLFLFVSKHNMCSYYGWVGRCCRRSVSTMHGHTGIIVGFVVVVICQ